MRMRVRMRDPFCSTVGLVAHPDISGWPGSDRLGVGDLGGGDDFTQHGLSRPHPGGGGKSAQEAQIWLRSRDCFEAQIFRFPGPLRSLSRSRVSMIIIDCSVSGASPEPVKIGRGRLYTRGKRKMALSFLWHLCDFMNFCPTLHHGR